MSKYIILIYLVGCSTNFNYKNGTCHSSSNLRQSRVVKIKHIYKGVYYYDLYINNCNVGEFWDEPSKLEAVYEFNAECPVAVKEMCL